MTREPDHFTPDAVEEQLDQVAQQVQERDSALARSPTLQVVADLQQLYDQQARAEAEARQRVRHRLLRTSAAARYLRQAQSPPTEASSVQRAWGTLGQRGDTPIQLAHRRNGPDMQTGFSQERRLPLHRLVRTGQHWSARASMLVAVMLLVTFVGGLTLGLILAHRANTGTPVGPHPHHTGAIREFPIPHCGSGCSPALITSGPDGNLWFTEDCKNTIGRITPAGRITEFPLPRVNRAQ
jgi:hypothetical protein